MKKIKIDIVFPVLNEEKILKESISMIQTFVKKQKQWNTNLIIVDNGSTDGTQKIASQLEKSYKNIFFISLKKKGKGHAVSTAWSKSQADVLSYMDIDLSTDLSALKHLITKIYDEKFDIAIGSRLVRGAKVYGRTFTREILSRSYNILTQCCFPGLGIKDLQCGFKAVSPRVAKGLLPHIHDKGLFFDSELLIIARNWKSSIAEIPIKWKDNLDTRINIKNTVKKDLKGLFNLRFRKIPKAPANW